MADARIQDLAVINRISGGDLFVLQHGEDAYSLQGQTLLNWLTAAADGHGGIKNTQLTGTNGLIDTYTITYADNSTSTFELKNGDSGVHLGTEPVPRTAMVWLDTTFSKDPVLKVRYSLDGPWQTIESVMGEPGKIISRTTEWQYDPQGETIPTNPWLPAPPVPLQGMYLWTRITDKWNSGTPSVTYTVSYQGQDGIGTVNSFNGIKPDPATHDVKAGLKDIPGDATHRTVTDEEKRVWEEGVTMAGEALPTSGGLMTGNINMNGHRITGLPEPTKDNEPVIKSMVDGLKWVDLWTNGSPNSDFAPDSYQVPGLSNYRFLAIETAFTAAGGARMGVSIYPMNVGVEMRLSAFIVSPAVFLETRYFTVHGDSISFENAYGAKATAFKAEIDNSRLVPIKIYGIK